MTKKLKKNDYSLFSMFIHMTILFSSNEEKCKETAQSTPSSSSKLPRKKQTASKSGGGGGGRLKGIAYMPLC